MIMSNVPDCVGVPEIVPPLLIPKPGGKPDAADHVEGGVNAPPVTVKVTGGYATPLVPFGRLDGEIWTRTSFSRFAMLVASG